MASNSLSPVSPRAALDAATLVLPSWIERGVTFRVLMIVLALLTLPLFFPWRETLTVPVTVTSSSPPRSVTLVEEGVIAAIAVQENQRVRAGQLLGQLGTSRDIEQVDRLQAYAERIVRTNGAETPPVLPPPFTLGGAVQRTYAALDGAVSELRLRSQHDDESQRIAALGRSMSETQARQLQTREAAHLSTDLVGVAGDRLQMKQQGAAAGWVSKDSVSAAREMLIERQLAARRAREQDQQLQSEVSTLGSEIARLQTSRELERARRRERLHQAASDLLGSIHEWRRQTALIAPIDGRVKFTSPRHIGDSVSRGGEFAVVVPDDGGVVATGTIPQESKGDVKEGALVRLIAPNYPPARYGYVHARVEKVSDVAVNGSYTVQLRLPNGLRTTSGAVLPLRNRAVVSGSIAVRHGRIVDVLLGQLLDGMGLN